MRNEPVEPRVRLAIARWPDDAPRGAVTTFCAEHAISRKTFYVLRARARKEGQAAVLEPRSRRPKSSPARITESMKDQAVAVRAALEASGLDHGPISVFDKMMSMGMDAPSIASLARIFRQREVARSQPRKRPRSSYRRFVYAAPNACWQLDATEYVLTGGRKCVIFQLEDDNSRVAVASHVAQSETSKAALIVFKKGVAARGVPQRLLTDNGIALNPSRRGWHGQLVKYAISLGVEPITGKPNKPSTQGKNERFHQTLFRWLDKQPLAESIEELQAQVDQFDWIYNHERPHQGLPGRMTPQQAWHATPVAQPPRPKPIPTLPAIPQGPDRTSPHDTVASPGTLRLKESGERQLKVYSSGSVTIRSIRFHIEHNRAGQTITATWDPTGITFIDNNGEIITERAWPDPGITYVGNGRSKGAPRHTKTKRNKPSPMS